MSEARSSNILAELENQHAPTANALSQSFRSRITLCDDRYSVSPTLAATRRPAFEPGEVDSNHSQRDFTVARSPAERCNQTTR
jgi:hypothetical protein